MEHGIEARSEYGCLVLTCDEETFFRLRAFICSEPSIAEAIRDEPEMLGLPCLVVRQPLDADKVPADPSWLNVISTVTAATVSGIALIVGFITIVRWLMHWNG